MKHFKSLFFAALLFASCQNFAQLNQSLSVKTEAPMKKESIHQFKVVDLNGDVFDFAKLKGKKIMVVNTASECGFTPQYKDLQALSEKYQDRLVIVGFPANNFGQQEPGTNKEIAAFCEKNYGVTFPMMEKISVKGDDMAPIYQFLTEQRKNGVLDSKVKWNFQKYLIDENGYLVKMAESKTLPNDTSIIRWIETTTK